jgi:adenylate cyclase
VVCAFALAVTGVAYFVARHSDTPVATLTPTNVTQNSIGTSNTEAEREYQAGIYIWNKRKAEEMPQALEHFQKAIELDPGFAQAYSGLANAYLWDGNPSLAPDEKRAHVKSALQRALAIDPNLAEAHTTLAFVLAGEWNWTEADREYQKAINADPNYPTAHHWYAEFLTFIGRDNEAVEHINKALELDPLSFAILNDAITVNWYVGRYEDAVSKAEKMIAFDKRYENQARLWLARLHQHLGNTDHARKEFEHYRRLLKGKVSDANYANFFALTGDRKQALKYIRKIENSGDKNKESLMLAGSYAVLGMREEAFAWLEVAFNTRHPSIVALAANPDFDGLRSDPRYMSLLTRMNLAEFWKDKIDK